MKEEYPVQACGGELSPNQGDQSVGNAWLGQIALSKNRQNVLDPRPRCLAEDVISADSIKVGLGRG